MIARLSQEHRKIMKRVEDFLIAEIIALVYGDHVVMIDDLHLEGESLDRDNVTHVIRRQGVPSTAKTNLVLCPRIN